MHYRYLSQLGDHYSGEVGTAGVRVNALNDLGAKLQSAIVALNAARMAAHPAAPPAGSSVKDRIKFFESGTDKVQSELQKNVLAAEQRVKRLTAWLSLQGASVNASGVIDWGMSAKTVVYDKTLAEQGMTKVRFNNGLMYMDDACKLALDTKGMVTHFSGPGFAIYVMGETGNLHVASHAVGHRHHSSLLGGQNTAGAGELKVEKGKLLSISNKSGHYAPSVAHLLQVLHQLQKRNVNLDQVKLILKTASGQTPYNTVQLFLDAVRAQGEPDFEYSKLLRYLVAIPFQDFANLAAAQGWRWVTDVEYNAGKRGVMTTAGIAVPHRDVRKWLKSLNKTAVPEVQSGYGR